MPVSLDILAPFEPAMEAMQASRDRTHEFGKYRSRGNALDDQQNQINYARAIAEQAAQTTALIEQIQQADESVLSWPQKAIASVVFASNWPENLDREVHLVDYGTSMFERARGQIERHRGIVAVVSDSYVELYRSPGADGLQPAETIHGRGKGIDLVMPEGRRMVAMEPTNRIFPAPLVAEIPLRVEIVHTLGYPTQAWRTMERFDPQSEHYNPPYIPLGTPEDPIEDINAHLQTDAQRYAARYIASQLGVHRWLNITAPGEEAQTATIERFARVFTDLLTGHVPYDKVRQIKSKRSPMDFGTNVSSERLRERSLVDFTDTERTDVFYAAGVDATQIEEATREKVAKLGEQSTAESIVSVLRANSVMDEFFVRFH